jgi:hypothetical protein
MITIFILKIILKLYEVSSRQYEFHKNSSKTRGFKGSMPVLRAFPFSVKLQCDNLVSHSGVGEYKKRTCAARPVMKVNHFAKN